MLTAETPVFEDLQFEHIDQLALDHPGSKDSEYRKRRDYIASLSKTFRETSVITDVEYTVEEHNVWQTVATKLEEIQAKRASKFYLDAKHDLGIRNDKIPQISELNKRLHETSGFKLAPIEGLVETRAFLSFVRNTSATLRVPNTRPNPTLYTKQSDIFRCSPTKILPIIQATSAKARKSPTTGNLPN
jgi:Biopterin-dependent aromatic amino acid hydroxylase